MSKSRMDNFKKSGVYRLDNGVNSAFLIYLQMCSNLR